MYFTGKKVLVIGGTGTIGKGIVQSILKENPQLIRIYSRDEYKQHVVRSDLGRNQKLQFMIGDIRHSERVYEAMQGIDYVFHLAAMKHVDICEANPYEAVLTNIVGMENVIHAGIKQNVKKVVFTSSDKAIAPTNAYGATKLIAERLISAAQKSKSPNQTIFASVRFGNVMGSRGSVIPFFQEEILKKNKVTVTDSDMTRFMMTIDQATELTIEALKEAEGGEVFVLKMPVIHLGTLVEVLIEEMCKKHHLKKDAIKIEVKGLRPGEKMYEELMTVDESKHAWELPTMYVLTDKARGKYHEGQQVTTGTYSSSSQQPLKANELRELLKIASLI